MKKKVAFIIILCLGAVGLILYFTSRNDNNMGKYVGNPSQSLVNESVNNNMNNYAISDNISDENTSEIKEIPENYYETAGNQGKLEEFYYDTYESRTYEQKTKRLRKRAIVYTPYGYDENKDREHRAFGGFSMGSVITWHTFANNLDSFYNI